MAMAELSTTFAMSTNTFLELITADPGLATDTRTITMQAIALMKDRIVNTLTRARAMVSLAPTTG
ncbi:hypothetical protein LTR85_010209 [Meristemomyces frigidus]|nr:hypothetical protein LTR85_010209 [Meristemomyces frigidus]